MVDAEWAAYGPAALGSDYQPGRYPACPYLQQLEPTYLPTRRDAVSWPFSHGTLGYTCGLPRPRAVPSGRGGSGEGGHPQSTYNRSKVVVAPSFRFAPSLQDIPSSACPKDTEHAPLSCCQLLAATHAVLPTPFTRCVPCPGIFSWSSLSSDIDISGRLLDPGPWWLAVRLGVGCAGALIGTKPRPGAATFPARLFPLCPARLGRNRR